MAALLSGATSDSRRFPEPCDDPGISAVRFAGHGRCEKLAVRTHRKNVGLPVLVRDPRHQPTRGLLLEPLSSTPNRDAHARSRSAVLAGQCAERTCDRPRSRTRSATGPCRIRPFRQTRKLWPESIHGFDGSDGCRHVELLDSARIRDRLVADFTSRGRLISGGARRCDER